jgi:hypothetical protein
VSERPARNKNGWSANYAKLGISFVLEYLCKANEPTEVQNGPALLMGADR